ncbi:MAG: helix-turn-helix transcriptional regulator [Actinomycetota bacterium]|nr:helix-turn-helix transcriptional regulator [Actinomycetota bacterium]
MKTAASYVNQARRAAGLSQRELAQRSGIPQSAIARIERGRQDPRVATLERLLNACDFELRLGPKRGGGVDESLIRSMLELSPAERLRASTAYGQFMERARRAKRLDRPA